LKVLPTATMQKYRRLLDELDEPVISFEEGKGGLWRLGVSGGEGGYIVASDLSDANDVSLWFDEIVETESSSVKCTS
jgi:hypothetical protein